MLDWIPEAIELLGERTGMSQKEMASRAGISERTLSRWVQGHAPRNLRLAEFAQAFHFEGTEEFRSWALGFGDCPRSPAGRWSADEPLEERALRFLLEPNPGEQYLLQKFKILRKEHHQLQTSLRELLEKVIELREAVAQISRLPGALEMRKSF